MREMSRFSCPVGVLIGGECKQSLCTTKQYAYPSPGQIVDSTELSVGDVVDLSLPTPQVVPADIMLLSGDAIVNESMLTGESVPVSKIPGKDLDILRWRDSSSSGADAAKSILYYGTKIVRVRKEGDSPVFGLVLRTGFDTTKGSLVRSMLFPKPMGFKFYRDSMRFIVVLTFIAGLGFLASAVQFVRLGVSACFTQPSLFDKHVPGLAQDDLD
jgi:cation-transporting P-type ATPase 13A2